MGEFTINEANCKVEDIYISPFDNFIALTIMFESKNTDGYLTQHSTIKFLIGLGKKEGGERFLIDLKNSISSAVDKYFKDNYPKEKKA